MKNYTLFFLAIFIVFPFNFFAQNSDSINSNKEIEYAQLVSNKTPRNRQVVGFYHVEEKINMKFGGRTTTYNVTSLNLVDKNNLGSNNTRVVTPKYINQKVTVVKSLSSEQIKVFLDTVNVTSKLINFYLATPLKVRNYANINILDTYERILEMGYKTADMLKLVADRHYFEGNFIKAENWYCELFDLTSDLDVEYYYRYAKSLQNTQQIEKGNEMMKLFEKKCVEK